MHIYNERLLSTNVIQSIKSNSLPLFFTNCGNSLPLSIICVMNTWKKYIESFYIIIYINAKYMTVWDTFH